MVCYVANWLVSWLVYGLRVSLICRHELRSLYKQSAFYPDLREHQFLFSVNKSLTSS